MMEWSSNTRTESHQNGLQMKHRLINGKKNDIVSMKIIRCEKSHVLSNSPHEDATLSPRRQHLCSQGNVRALKR